MLATSLVQLSQEPIKPGIGTRIFNSKQELLSGQFAGGIRELLEQRVPMPSATVKVPSRARAVERQSGQSAA